jgi:hypothetical protein
MDELRNSNRALSIQVLAIMIKSHDFIPSDSRNSKNLETDLAQLNEEHVDLLVCTFTFPAVLILIVLE